MIVELSDFQRYELRCYCCGKIIGYMSVPFSSGSNSNVVTGTYNARTSVHMPVCCPNCEETRLTAMKRQKYNALDHYYTNIIP